MAESPILCANGLPPDNGHFRPTEWWWANRQFGYTVDSRWNFYVVALADGRFSTDSSVYAIERNNSNWIGEIPRPCVFDTREQALRVAAARLIRQARSSRKWPGLFTGKLEGEKLAMVINWTRTIIARQTGKSEPAPIIVWEPPRPRPKTGLPLLDFGFGESAPAPREMGS